MCGLTLCACKGRGVCVCEVVHMECGYNGNLVPIPIVARSGSDDPVIDPIGTQKEDEED